MQDGSDHHHAYRLKHWPNIPERFRTAKVLRACSRMSVGPVTANWFHSHIGLDEAGTSELLAAFTAVGAIERLELGSRPAGWPAAPRVAPAPAPGPSFRQRVARRFAWKQAAAAALVCLAVTAALEHRLPAGLGQFAFPDLVALFG
jgi:hypothetical protein